MIRCLFTIEGSLHGVLALVVVSLYCIPLLILTAAKGIPLPDLGDAVGIAMATGYLFVFMKLTVFW